LVRDRRKYLNFLYTLLRNMNKLADILAYLYLAQELYQNPKYRDRKRLGRFEYQVYSQSGEDGLLAEVFNRIGATNRIFVEFGVGDGLESNTTYLLLNDWTGYWVERDQGCVRAVRERFGSLVEGKRLTVCQAHVTAENVCDLFARMQIPREFDLLSIDVDGNDYWIWKHLAGYSPRVIVIEYNALFRPPVKWVMRYDPQHHHTGTSYFGASLKSLEILGREKGYALVACSFTGVNAFFVRRDLLDRRFSDPYTAENHYEPPRYYLIRQVTHHMRDFGDFESI